MTDLSRARELCTAAELRFLESCRGRTLAKASEAQLKERIALARELRDKWWEAFTRQRRRAKRKQGFPASRGSMHSQKKSELFAEVLARVEARLKKVAASPAVDVTPERSVGRKPSSRERVRSRRLTRAANREHLEEQRTRFEVRGVQPEQLPEPMVHKAVPAKPKETAAAPRRAMQKEARKPRGPAGQAENIVGQRPSRQQRADAATKRDQIKYGQQGASAAPTRDRIKTAGLDTRIRAHIVARGRRSQARRDYKK